MSKFFSPDEANALLPLLREELQRLQVLTRQYEENYMDLQDRKADHPGTTDRSEDLFFAEELQLDFMRLEIRAAVRGFELKGVYLKMIDPGLIDFPARIGGKDVLLCWKQGEPSVSHYHGWEEGFIGRKRLQE